MYKYDAFLPCSHNDALIKDISHKECFEAICTFPNGKTPGTDGLPAEFYAGDENTALLSVYRMLQK